MDNITCEDDYEYARTITDCRAIVRYKCKTVWKSKRLFATTEAATANAKVVMEAILAVEEDGRKFYYFGYEVVRRNEE